MLNVNNLNVFYDKIHAIKNVHFRVKEGQIVTFIGANGAGKTTILQTVSGLLKPKSGEVSFLDEDILKIAPHKILHRGLAHVPEGRRIFSHLTVMENIEMGAYIRNDKRKIKEDMDKIFDKFPRLKERTKQYAGTLSGGEQQMLAMARALMSNPKMLLLDEPSMGLAPILVDEIFEIIKQVNKNGVTVLLVEQNAKKALEVADYAYVLETGKVVKEGEAEGMLSDNSVMEAYLGK